MKQPRRPLRPRLIADAPNGKADHLQTMYLSTSGMYFVINPAFDDAITELIAIVRAAIKAARDAGQLLAYLSIPISARGGGNFDINTEIAAATTANIQSRFGSGLAVINSAAFVLPDVGGSPAGGGEYMAVWSDVIAGADGNGNEFDMIYFVGPSDVAHYFGLPDANRLGAIEQWIDARAAVDPKFKTFIEKDDNRRQFVRYYGLRGSAVYSKGAHDEWNIAVAINGLRPTGDDIAVYFDGRPVEPGDYDDVTDPGYQAI